MRDSRKQKIFRESPAGEKGDAPYLPENCDCVIDYLQDKDRGLYVESYFHEILCLERKRSERSGKPLVLMLLNIEGVREQEGIVRSAGKALSTLTRETDVKGWYKIDSVMGILFTETNDWDEETLRKRMQVGLCTILGRDTVDKIVISVHVFPERSARAESDSPIDLTLYADLAKKEGALKTSLFLKRALDVIGSIVGLILFAPLFLLIPILIKASSEGPVFFRQERVGRYGKRFTFLKFRSMYVNNCDAIHREYVKALICAERGNREGNGKKGGAEDAYKIKEDSRITSLGRLLRKTSLDELPQFLNVLRGEMSLVGPRPPIPYEVEQYDIWHRRRLLEVKPGITGLWQVKGRSSTTFDEMVRLDLKYSREWSIWLDLKILFRTPLVVLIGKGAY